MDFSWRLATASMAKSGVIQRRTDDRLDMRQGRRLGLQTPHELLQRLPATPGLYQHTLRIVPYLPDEAAFPGEPPYCRPKAHALHGTGYPDAFTRHHGSVQTTQGSKQRTMHWSEFRRHPSLRSQPRICDEPQG